MKMVMAMMTNPEKKALFMISSSWYAIKSLIKNLPFPVLPWLNAPPLIMTLPWDQCWPNSALGQYERINLLEKKKNTLEQH